MGTYGGLGRLDRRRVIDAAIRGRTSMVIDPIKAAKPGVRKINYEKNC